MAAITPYIERECGRMIRFISYDGEYPALCCGTLTIEVNGIKYELEDCLHNDCSISDTEDWEEEEWRVDVPNELEECKEGITEIVNDNVEHGCCGGCI